MRNFKLKIEYDGTHYAGWQAQGKQKTIQAVLERALRKILQEKIRLIASGRTDAGVHAECQVANFKTGTQISPEKLQRALNGLLPEDVAVTGIKEEGQHFHSRFCAKSKVYRYTILNRKFPCAFLRGRVYFYPYPLNVRLMREEAGVLLGRHDFKSFQAKDKKERGSIRTLKKIKITSHKGFIHIDMEADGFLYNMARNIAGTLVEIGRGRFAKGSLKKILRGRDRRLAGSTAPAKGLCLREVKY